MHVSEILDEALLNENVKEGYIRCVAHPSLPYFIYGYSEKAQFDRRWNEATLNCRGLILSLDGNVIARPWKKFFNLGEGFADIDWTTPVEVTDKMDGSLGILYPTYDGHGHAIATRGSFVSEQAIHATKVWWDQYADVDVPEGLTFLFEIIYPANRIVLNYEGLDDLVLLGAVNNEYGYYIGPTQAQGYLGWTGPVTETFHHSTLQEAFSADHRPNAEGYVVRSGNKMVKIKQVDYIELHRIVTNLNDRTIWNLMKDGKTPRDICEQIPDEWHDWVKATYADLDKHLTEKVAEIVVEYSLIKPGLDRKSFAMIASKSPNRAYLFKMYDGKKIQDDVLETLKPDVSRA